MDLQQLVRVANFLGVNTARPAKTQQQHPNAAKIGILGASQVSTYAVIWPSRHLEAASIAAVAARSEGRAKKFAQQHSIPCNYGSYQELLADPNVDAVYIGLPNGLHGQWARHALESGKHVLCEKPFCTNAAEARELQSLALKNGLICREAFHYREHPLATRLREITLGPPRHSPTKSPTVPQWMAPPAAAAGAGGLLGQLESIDVQVLIPKWVFGDANIRFLEELAGGAMMDAGTYAVSIMRLLSGAEPRVESASASMRPGSEVVDGAMRARLSWDNGIAGTLHASLQHEGLLPVTEVQVEGERGHLTCEGFIVPFFGHNLRVTTKKAGSMASCDTALTPSDDVPTSTAATVSHAFLTGYKSTRGESKGRRGHLCRWTERVFGEKQQTSYYHQLERFTTDLQVLEGRRADRDIANVKAACAFDAYDSVANMAILDACFEAAGLPLRMPTTEWQQ